MTPRADTTKDASDKANGRAKVAVNVNNHPVELDHRRVSGLEIKQAAIEQGVEIELDFILVDEGTQPPRVIGDDDTITVTKKSRFTANASDDNS